MGAKETAIPSFTARLYERTWVRYNQMSSVGSDTDDAVVLQGLTRQLSDNLHVGILWTLLIINGLSRFLKARLPIFSGNLVFDFRVKALSVSAFCASFRCRLFHFCLQLFQILAAWGSRVCPSSSAMRGLEHSFI